jgi:predicted PurR-regulated permease PerM
MSTPDAHTRASSAIPADVRSAARQEGLVVTVRFDRRSVWRSGLILVGLVAGLLLFLWLFSALSHFLFLVLLAWLFSIALEPGIRWLVQRGRSRGVATAVVGGSALAVALVLAAVFGQLFFTQIADFVSGVPELTNSVTDWVNGRFGTALDPTTISSTLHLEPSQIALWAGSLSGGVLGVVGSLSSVLFDLVTVLVFGFYFADAGPDVVRRLASMMPPRGQQVFVTVSEITIAKTGGYVVSKIVLAALSAFFHGIFFAAIGVPYWLPFALFAGITAQFVPIVGTYLGVILPVLATAFTSPWKAIAIIAFAAVYQQLETYVFTPRVSKRTMDVNPAIALGAVFVGAAIWGPLGALIGIPLAAAGVAILDTYSHRYELVPDVLNVGDAMPDPEPT